MRYGKQSKQNLNGVHPDLVFLYTQYILEAEVDISIVCGLRDALTQKEYYRTGKSQTMYSKHLKQKDGYAHAVDWYPWHNGRTDHSEELYRKVQSKLHELANKNGIFIVHGGLWASFRENINGRIQYGDNAHTEIYIPDEITSVI